MKPGGAPRRQAVRASHLAFSCNRTPREAATVAQTGREIMSNFHNMPDALLADEIGQAHSDIKAREARLDLLKEEFKRRELTSMRGSSFVVTASTSASKRLDVKRLRELLGDALDEYENETVSTRINVKALAKEAA
jgi:hypothetical protein